MKRGTIVLAKFPFSDLKSAKTGLKVDSVIRTDKLATLNLNIFSGEIGKISKNVMSKIDISLKISLCISS